MEILNDSGRVEIESIFRRGAPMKKYISISLTIIAILIASTMLVQVDSFHGGGGRAEHFHGVGWGWGLGWGLAVGGLAYFYYSYPKVDYMELHPISPVKVLSKAFLKQYLKREQIEPFMANLAHMFERICADEREDLFRNIVSDN